MRKTASGYRRGERHPRARVSDHDVNLAIQLVTVHGLSSREVAVKFSVAARTVRDWVNRTTRAL